MSQPPGQSRPRWLGGRAPKEIFSLNDAELIGPLPADATALRVVRVGGGSLLRGSKARALDSAPSEALKAGSTKAQWPRTLLVVKKTMYPQKPVCVYWEPSLLQHTRVPVPPS
jgi:hypothetical protein